MIPKMLNCADKIERQELTKRSGERGKSLKIKGNLTLLK
jgi:hypothetical protein